MVACHRRLENNILIKEYVMYMLHVENGVAQWLRCSATNRKVAGSIPDGVIGIFL